MRPPITPNMRIRDILTHHPQTARVLRAYGIRCEDCHAARYESLGQGAEVHGIHLPSLLQALNDAALRPERTPSLPLTGN